MNGEKEVYRDFGDIIKHESRLRLWLPALIKLKNSLGRELKYFTLPGPKAYDVIRWKTEGIVKHDGKGFPDICFCEYEEANFINAKRILGNTRGIKAKFEDVILAPDSKSKYRAFWDLFPYDAYNLDFCGTWFESEEPLSQTFRSIIELINAHVRKGSDFLLFLTIRIDKNKTNITVINDLKDNLESNRRVPELLSKIQVICGNDINQFIKRNFNTFILISIPKLIAFKIIPQTKKLSGKIEDGVQAYYSRGRYYIGKFVFLINKEKTTLRINPPWYTDFVSKCFDLENIVNFGDYRISKHTKDDLIKLKREIKSIEGYEKSK